MIHAYCYYFLISEAMRIVFRMASNYFSSRIIYERQYGEEKIVVR